jgi:hypothetical protein
MLVGVLSEDALSHGVCFQEILKGVFVEKGDPRVPHPGLSDFQPVDLPGRGEDLPKSKRLVRPPVEDLQSQRIHDSLASPQIKAAHAPRLQAFMGGLLASGLKNVGS